jgi:protein SCO1/2
MAAAVCGTADDESAMSAGLNGRAVMWGGMGVIATVLCVALFARFLTSAEGPARRGPTETTVQEPKLLRSDPVAERAAYEREKNARLHSYGWIDRERGIAHIPIERAMELQASAEPTTAASANARVAEWDQRLGAPLPLELEFTDETGRSTRLGKYFGAMPVAIAFVYLRCEKLCPVVLGGVDEALRSAGLVANRDYRLLAVSIDPRDAPAQAEQRAKLFASAGVHVLTSATGTASQLAAAAGFRYVAMTGTAQFAHPAGFLVATPQGRISRYFFGVRYPARQVRSAIESAGNGFTGGLAERLFMVCFGVDEAHDVRSAGIMIALRLVTLALLLALAIFGWQRYLRRASR